MSLQKSQSLLSKASLPVRSTGPTSQSMKNVGGLKQQTSRLSEVSASTISRLGVFAGNVTKSLGNIGEGPFDRWTRFEIVEALIRDGHTIRDEVYITVSNLRTLAETVFADREDFPLKPLPYTLDEQRRRNEAACVIQNAWFNRLIYNSERKTFVDIVNLAKSKKKKSFKHQLSANSFPEVTLEELGVATVDDEYDDYTSDEDEESGKYTNPILEQPWVAPSWEYARMYADYNHPRLGGLGGKEMDWLRTTTGRHCTTGGFGEQCDLWEEKQVSELGRYGPGITNYFKFIKWCFWVYVVLSVMYFPMLVLNTFGRGDEQTAHLNSLSQTMAGNLGDTNATQTLHYPKCEDNVRGQSCELSKHDVAIMYGYLDFFATIIVLIAYVWLRIFEVKEETVLNKNTVSASNYTVAVKGFRSDIIFSEAELKKHFAEVTSQGVSCVSVAYDNEKEIELYKTRGDLMKQRIRCTQEYRYYRSLQKEGKSISQGFLEDVLDKRINTTAKIRQIDVETEHRAKLVDKPIYAFVTFEHAIGARIAIRAYSKSIWGYFHMKDSLKFKGSKLIVQEAADPSTILWENLRYRRIDRSQRRMLTTFVTIILLGVSLLVSIISRTIDQNAADHGGNEICPKGFGDLPTEQQQEMVDTDSSLLHCYCDELTFEEQKNDSYCQKYYKQTLSATLFSYFAAFVVLSTNSGIDMYLSRSAEYEKHHSADSQERSIFLRMFLLKLVNTGVLFLFANFFGRINAVFGVTSPSTGDFTTSWYQTVGVGICLVQIGDIISPHLWKIYKYRQRVIRMRAAATDPTKGSLTQEELNELHLGPEFVVSHRYAQLMSNWFVCYMFCTGMPILPIVAMLNFYMSYWVDKYLFLRFYRSPPRYKSKIGKIATSIIPYAVIVHLGVSIWTLGNQKIFLSGTQTTGGVDLYGSGYSPYSVQAKISQKHTFPLFILLIVVVIALVIAKIFDEIIHILHSFAKALFGSMLARSEFYQELERFLLNTINISYSRAVRRGVIKGLATYNILQNPRYKEAFNISDGFALSHTRVKSLRNFGRISFEGMAELESHDKGLTENTNTLVSPEIRDLASVEGGQGIELNRVHRNRRSSASSDDNSVHSESSKKKKSKMTAGEERTQIIMRTLEEEEEEEALQVAREAEAREAEVARYLASISEDEEKSVATHQTSRSTKTDPTQFLVSPRQKKDLPIENTFRSDPLSPPRPKESRDTPMENNRRSDPISPPRPKAEPVQPKADPKEFTARPVTATLVSSVDLPRPVTATMKERGVSESNPPNAPVTNLTIKEKDRRITSPAILQSIIGDDDDDDEANDILNDILNRPSDDGIAPRPVSAYVDLQQSYAPLRDSREMSLHDNPMQSMAHSSPIHRAKAATVHSTKLEESLSKQAQRRPSPTDLKNLEDFKKGRSSKRAAGKTQL